MKNIQYILLVALVMGTSLSLHGQTKKAWIKAAEEAWAESDYYSSLYYFNEALQFDTTSLTVRYNLAQSARRFNAYSLASEHYQYVLDNDTEGTYGDVAYHLADMKRLLGQYQEASDLFNIYIGEQGGNDEALTRKANEALENISYAQDKLANYDESVLIERLPDGVNTPFSEFGAAESRDLLYYTSHQFRPNDKEQRLLGKILASEELEEGILAEVQGMDTKSIANATFSEDGTWLVCAICDYINPDSLRCDLYRGEMASDTSISALNKLPEPINALGHTTTQPYLSTDGEQTTLYFSSDRKGGKGGMDLYAVAMQADGSFGTVESLSAINTAGDDITPYFSVDRQELFFSSNGRKGLGGYDIYSAELRAGQFSSNVNHLDAHTNSSYHDIHYKIAKDGTSAYFSSNRKGALFIDPGQEACCFDIFEAKFDIIEIPLNAMTYDLLTQDSLTGVTVRLVDARTGRELEVVHNPRGKDHKFRLEKGRDYLIISEKPGYISDTTTIETAKLDGPIEQKIYLDSDRHALDALTFDARTREALRGAKLRLIDLSDNTIADQVQVNTDGNDFMFILEPGKQYRLEASKDGYIATSLDISTVGPNIPKRIKKELYLDSLDLNQYLPVSLYFDNDQPNPESNRTATSAKYSDLYYDYIKEKAAFQKRNPQERDGLENFFEQDLKGGYVRMQKFYDELYKTMQAGLSIDLTIKGHTSPLALNPYNLVLGQRRVNSVKNDMAAYRGGILREYIENGQIKITDISYGEEVLRNKDLSDSPRNKRQSIYSVDASQERRVEIIKVSKQ